jgi:hypothetical protein
VSRLIQNQSIARNEETPASQATSTRVPSDQSVGSDQNTAMPMAAPIQSLT